VEVEVVVEELEHHQEELEHHQEDGGVVLFLVV
jgi:hypothetical protein